MNRRGGGPRFLASVASVEEARIAVAGGADIIDCKDPQRGALGALDADVVRAIRAAVPRDLPVSATIGDLPAEAAAWSGPVLDMAATGIDYIKIGIFPGLDARAAIQSIGRVAIGPTRLIAVLLADRDPDFGLIDTLAGAGFAGVMLDTGRKTGRSLPDVMDDTALREFVRLAQSCGMLAGLAGSLRREHIRSLAALAPDVLGFRGALCAASDRTGGLDAGRVGAVRDALASEDVSLPRTRELARPGLEPERL